MLLVIPITGMPSYLMNKAVINQATATEVQITSYTLPLEKEHKRPHTIEALIIQSGRMFMYCSGSAQIKKSITTP